jgi:hypothetical protein
MKLLDRVVASWMAKGWIKYPKYPRTVDTTQDEFTADMVRRLKEAPLLELRKDQLPHVTGVYALTLDSDLYPVYIGRVFQTSPTSTRTMFNRLSEHIKRMTGRLNINAMRFRYLTFDAEWVSVAAEHALIEYYKPTWNYSGFGSKAPGKGRPGIGIVSDWDKAFPKAGE